MNKHIWSSVENLPKAAKNIRVFGLVMASLGWAMLASTILMIILSVTLSPNLAAYIEFAYPIGIGLVGISSGLAILCIVTGIRIKRLEMSARGVAVAAGSVIVLSVLLSLVGSVGILLLVLSVYSATILFRVKAYADWRGQVTHSAARQEKPR